MNCAIVGLNDISLKGDRKVQILNHIVLAIDLGLRAKQEQDN